jgi:hypothetical protein
VLRQSKLDSTLLRKILTLENNKNRKYYIMKIQLNTSERILTIGILNQFKGDLNKLAEIILDLKGLNLKPEEIEELGIKNDGQSIT